MAPSENIGADVFAKIVRLGIPGQQFLFGFKTALPGRNKVGGIVECIKSWNVLTAGIEWPDCYECEDTGVLDDPTSPFEGKAPCGCGAGKRAQKTKFPKWHLHAAAQAEGKSFCPECEGTGKPIDSRGLNPDRDWSDLRSFRGDEYCSCPIGMESLEHAKKQHQREAEEIQQFREQGICPDCRGSKVGSADSESRCFSCRGTGLYFSDEQLKEKNICHACWGTLEDGFPKHLKPCLQCGGTGKWVKRTR